MYSKYYVSEDLYIQKFGCLVGAERWKQNLLNHLVVSEETNCTILLVFNMIPFYGSYQLNKFWPQPYKLYVKKKPQPLADFNELWVSVQVHILDYADLTALESLNSYSLKILNLFVNFRHSSKNQTSQKKRVFFCSGHCLCICALDT